ncbi:hypothetical protein JCM6882_000285 [Rhodosporidiobolus microsporus]
MDIFSSLQAPAREPILCVGMHTTGEPTRIVVRGVDHLLRGKRLLDKRDCAREEYDHLRKRLMFEPRGHSEMYGAYLIKETELTIAKDAHMGVLFTHGEGYSTMCGHATMALGRFLVDTQDEETFPARSTLVHDPTTSTTQVNLHAPCGLVEIAVPTLLDGSGKITYDPSRLVSFVSVPSFATAVDLDVEAPEKYRWPELGDRTRLTVDVAYGGAFYAIVQAPELGFPTGLRGASLPALSFATEKLKALIMAEHAWTTQHPTEEALSYLYGVVVVDEAVAEGEGEETGLCFFADQQVDRSPTGSAVSARLALAFTKGLLGLNEPRRYHSVVSLASDEPAKDAFEGEAVEELRVEGGRWGEGEGRRAVRVKTSGRAYYTDASAFVAEEDDYLSKAGFQVALPQ